MPVTDDSLPFASDLPAVAWPAVISPRGMAVTSLLYQLDRTQWWRAERLQHHQRTQLRHLIAYCTESVPFYRDRLGSLTDVSDDGFAAAWSELPILTRRQVQEAGDALLSTAIPEGHGGLSEIFTSGSTGQPIRALRTELWQIFWSAVTVREHLWHGRDLSAKLAVIRDSATSKAPWPDGEHFERWGFSTADIFATGPSVGLNITTPVEQQLDWLMRQAPDYLLTHPTILDRLVRLSLATGARPAQLRQVLTISEALPPGLRDLCRGAWNVRIADTYSTREAGYLALQCPLTDHYHVQSETVLVEVVDEAGRPCAPGEIGRVIATPLHNMAMPLLRYDVGDFAEFGEPCTCGRGLPVIRRILGRRQNMLKLPTGDERWPLLSSSDIGKLLGLAPIRHYKFIQTHAGRIELRFVTARTLSAEEESRVVAWARDKFGDPFDFNVAYADTLPLGASGKFEDFVSLV